MKDRLMQEFIKVFGEGGEIKTYFAPGRVNLIGEHTDYNGGHVFPCALTIGTYAVARKREDTKLRFFSMNFERLGMMESGLDSLEYDQNEGWINYPKGVIYTMKKKGYDIPAGMDILYFGNIPNGAGLSSSASIEVLTGYILRDIYELALDNVELSLLCQESENEYNGVNCGIMDQFAIAMGKKDKAIFLNTNTMKYEYVDVQLDDYKIVIMNTNKKRELADSKYNERRSECEIALSDLQSGMGITTLCDLNDELFGMIQVAIRDYDHRSRAKHVVSENQRTIKAVDALNNGDLVTFGQLMTASHESLRDDYEVTGEELDTLVAAALEQNEVLGARMTGAGFGGCAIALVKDSAIEAFIENVGEIYEEKIGYKAEFYVVEVGDGPCVL